MLSTLHLQPFMVMRPLTPFIVLITFLTACGPDQEHNASPSRAEFPISYIQRNSHPREEVYNLDTLNLVHLQVIDSTFFRKWLQRPIVNTGKMLEFNVTSRYYFFDFADEDSLLIFSVIEDDEAGYDNIYYYTYSQKQKNIVSADLVASTGGDGNYSTTDILDFTKRGKLKLTTVSVSENEHGEGFVMDYDSVVKDIIFTGRGPVFLLLDSVNRKDTILEDY